MKPYDPVDVCSPSAPSDSAVQFASLDIVNLAVDTLGVIYARPRVRWDIPAPAIISALESGHEEVSEPG
ncbi:hypothetical protein DPMN_161640 [Dreissena polymorpha]|uniref:Uncharacterized protein n=1 Tax=Dreissena polymorpha TaxID=45954 RepID=A0A9D4ISW2_DREPO|nr:hypothetical protein DPMN_161640 [Dreissena polymorpha]